MTSGQDEDTEALVVMLAEAAVAPGPGAASSRDSLDLPWDSWTHPMHPPALASTLPRRAHSSAGGSKQAGPGRLLWSAVQDHVCVARAVQVLVTRIPTTDHAALVGLAVEAKRSGRSLAEVAATILADDAPASRFPGRAPLQPPTNPPSVVRALGCTVVTPHHDLDLATADDLAAALTAADDDGGSIVVDLSGVDFIDLRGVRPLLSQARRSTATQRAFLLVAGPPNLSGILSLFPPPALHVVTSHADALIAVVAASLDGSSAAHVGAATT